MKTILQKRVGKFKQGDNVYITSSKYKGLRGRITRIHTQEEWSKCDTWEGKYPIRVRLSGEWSKYYHGTHWVHCKQIELFI